MHEMYRKYMNLVDLHNKLRSGVTSMADVWKTSSWEHRHFAELLGFMEVNIFKTLTYFRPDKFLSLTHNNFRARLAWALLTLGKAPYPDGNSSHSAPGGTSGSSSASASLAAEPSVHQMVPFALKGEAHACAYCGHRTHLHVYCKSCEENGHGIIPTCGRKSHRNCIECHARGDKITHSSWVMGKRKAQWGNI